MENIKATHPLELIYLDFLSIIFMEGGQDIDILMITDHFMQYLQALLTLSQTARCTLWKRL